MLQQLLESRVRPPRRRLGSTASVTVHAAAVGLAVAATGRAEPRAPDPRPPLVYLAAPRAEAPPSPAGATPEAAGSPRGRRLTRPAPRSPGLAAIPPTPTVDVGGVALATELDAGRPLVEAADFAPGGLDVGGGRPRGAAPAGGVFDAPAVDEPVVADRGNRPPRYPEALRAAGVGGRVVARFVVDTLGRVEVPTVRIVTADDPLLAAAVRDAVWRYRFTPARSGGLRVRQLVEVPFAFAVGGAPPGAPPR